MAIIPIATINPPKNVNPSPLNNAPKGSAMKCCGFSNKWKVFAPKIPPIKPNKVMVELKASAFMNFFYVILL